MRRNDGARMAGCRSAKTADLRGTLRMEGPRHVERAARRAQIGESGVHRLRHTFCSHLAMRGAPARAIQELAGHTDLTTTQRSMHLSPAAIESAIRLLEHGGRGDILETRDQRTAK